MAELGVCPAATEIRADGVNRGKNGGRICWAISGTMCRGEVQGTYASKVASCEACDFFQSVQQDLREGDPSGILDLFLERTASLEHEIEQRQQVEKALRQTNKKLNLLSSITRHDMLNKLHTIGLLMELVGQNYSHDPDLIEQLGKIETQFRDLTDMVWFTNDYQELGVEAPAWQPLNNVIAEVRRWVTSIPIEMDAGLEGYAIFADPLLVKVFYNLADNAVLHGGHASRIRVRGVVEPEGLVIFWEDDGVGVPHEGKDKIFSRGHGENTGLGLFLVREILSITGVTIRETGIPGKGARFEMIVPEGSYRCTGP